MKRNKGITLVALVITIILLLILAGITLMALTGDNGLFTRAKEAKEKTQKEAAIEKINLVIADVYTKSYGEKQEEPTLQDLADGLCEDEETEYVDVGTRKTSALDKIEVGTNEAIYVKLKKYPYEFKINGALKIVAIDGIEVSETTGGTGNTGNGENDGNGGNGGSTVTIDKEEYENLKSTVDTLTGKVNSLIADLNNLKNNIETSNFTRVKLYDKGEVFNTPTTWTEIGKDITLPDISSYKYLEFQIDNNGCYEKTIIIAREQLIYNNSNTISYTNNSTFLLDNVLPEKSVLCCWLKNSTTLRVGYGYSEKSGLSIRIKKINGIL